LGEAAFRGRHQVDYRRQRENRSRFNGELEGNDMGGDSLPRWVKPQLCALIDEPPDGSEWLHEIKYDGYRMHARLDRGKAQLLTRTGLDWTHKYPPIAAALSVLPVREAYVDGELCGVRPDGKT
jgi:ATP-dependent DNA ligase